MPVRPARSPLSRAGRSLGLLILLLTVVGSGGPASGRAGHAGAGEAGVAVPPDAVVTITGRGFGHGHGLSQYGAEGAARRGLSHQRILRFYYPHTRLGRLPGGGGGLLRVLVSADTSDDVRVRAADGLTLTRLSPRGSWRLDRAVPRADQWRLVAPDADHTAAQWKRGSGGWRTWRTVAGEAQLSAPAALTLVTPSGRTAYRGALRSAATGEGSHRDTVDVVRLDDYLRGVVPAEVPALWHGAAVRAQAVAARTYAAYERDHASGHYDLCDTAACQVYLGRSAEHPASDAAVRATARTVLLHGGAPAFAQFSASNGGYASDGGFPYLPDQKDPYDRWSGNPYRSWSVEVPDETFEAAWPALGDLETIAVTERDGNGNWGGRAVSVRMTGSDGETTVSGDTLRIVLGLRSTLFTLDATASPRPSAIAP